MERGCLLPGVGFANARRVRDRAHYSELVKVCMHVGESVRAGEGRNVMEVLRGM